MQTRYIGTRKGDLSYLFLLLTEDYIESHVRIITELAPHLERFGRMLGDHAAFVRPFRGDEERTLGDAKEKGFTNEQILAMRRTLPALLVIDTDFDDFNASSSNYLFVSLRDVLDSTAAVRLFEMEEILQDLSEEAKASTLFERIREYIPDKTQHLLGEAIEAKPGIFGFSIDLKKLLEALSDLRRRRVLAQAR